MATKPLRKIIQHEAYRIVLLQLAGVAVLAIACLVRSRESSFAVLMGGLAYGLPNLAFVWRVFRYTGAHQMERFMAAFFFGEMIKLILSAVLFLLIVKYLPVSLLSVLVGFIGAIVSFWIVCMWHFSKKASIEQNMVRL
ncbi:MAG: ATP synthase subunit I [Gammaproteobacteria bacterium]|nr:ATP synthase subunit I [Gammaproteobacteria bacterium]